MIAVAAIMASGKLIFLLFHITIVSATIYSLTGITVDPLINVSHKTCSFIDLKLNPSVSILVIADYFGRTVPVIPDELYQCI